MTSTHLADITRVELQLLAAAVGSIDVDEVKGEALHLRVLADGRQWIVESEEGQLVVDIVDESCRGEETETFALSERVRRFADCFADDVVSLSIADDRTIIATAGTATAAIDLVPQQRPTPSGWMIVPSATVAVSLRQFQMLLWSARCLPSGVGDVQYPMPPMWLQFDGDWLGLHVDWTDFLPSRATYRLVTSMHRGHITTSIPHTIIEAFLRHVPMLDDDDEDIELCITVGTVRHHGDAREAIMLEAEQWRLVLWLTDAMNTRWATKVNAELAAHGFEVLDNDDVEWLVRDDGVDVRVKLHHGHPDVARISGLLVQSAEETIELLRELGQLNASSTGLRYWLEDGAVRVAADVRCTALPTLGGAVHAVAAATKQYSPLLSALGAAAG